MRAPRLEKLRLPRLSELRAVIFDRDGTLNASGPDDNGGYILDPAQLQLLAGVKDALAGLHEKGVLMFVFSQQNCVAKGLISEAGVDAVHATLNEALAPAAIKSFYFNTQARAGTDWSKPAAGMLNAILAAHPELNAGNTLVVGDAARDAESADAAGLPFAFVESDQPSKTAEARKTGRPVYGSLDILIKSLK